MTSSSRRASSRPAPSGSPALDAVARVRSMREQDSLFGLQQAQSQARADRARLEALQARLDVTPEVASPEGPTGDFLQARTALLTVGSAVTDARVRLGTTDAVALAARSRWEQDRTALDAVTELMDRRALEREAELRRREARDQDEIAGQRWARQDGSR